MKGNFWNKKRKEAHAHTHTKEKVKLKRGEKKERTEGCNWTTVIRIQESQNLPSFTLYRRRKGN
jgi:hypothetical protein